MSARHLRAALVACVGGAACAPSPAEKLAALGLGPTSEAALAQLRFTTLQVGDRVDADDLILCGERDRALLGFSRQQVVTYLGLDADWLVPELFATRGDEALLAVPPRQLARVRLPRGVGSTGNPPPAWVREVAGYPAVSRDLGGVLSAFGDEHELFAVRPTSAPVAPTLPAAAPAGPWRLGVTVFPRMGPQPGVMVADVEPGSPAARAKLTRGDRILSVDDQPLRSFADLKRAVAGGSSRIRLKVQKKSSAQIDELVVELSAPSPGENLLEPED